MVAREDVWNSDVFGRFDMFGGGFSFFGEDGLRHANVNSAFISFIVARRRDGFAFRFACLCPFGRDVAVRPMRTHLSSNLDA